MLGIRAGSSFRVEAVDLRGFAESASRVLRNAWEPPCLLYSPEYLHWQLSFPGASAAIGVAAFDGATPVGFFGATPRWMRHGQARIATHLMSFFAVEPDWRGPQTLALYARLIEEMQKTGWPVLTFVQPDSAAEQMLTWNFERAGFRIHPMGDYRTYGAVARQKPASLGVSVAEVDDDEFLAVARCCHDAETLWNDPDRHQLRHYRCDPRGRALVSVRDASGCPVGAAMLVLSETVAPQGPEFIPMIDSVFLAEPTAEVLIALIQFSRERWAGHATSPVVTAPNLRGIDPTILRAAGLRATPSAFRGYFFSTMADVHFEAVAGTNLEIV
jgi:hypothetical protein